MEFGRFVLSRSGSLLAFTLVLLCGSSQNGWTQQAPPPANPRTDQAPSPALPLRTPAFEAARSGAGNREQAAEPADECVRARAGSSAGVNSPRLRLGAGDLLEVGVYNVPELSTKARVGNYGRHLPSTDRLCARGRSDSGRSARFIQKRLEDGGFVRSAHVTIFLDESVSQGVTILGEVAKPGIYPAMGDRRLYDLISAAGGFTTSAGRKVSVIRQHSADLRLL